MNLDFYEVIRDISVNQHYANRYVKMMRHYQSLRLKKGERHTAAALVVPRLQIQAREHRMLTIQGSFHRPYASVAGD